ncbi:DUF6083 domain-containing protein [Citricoccus sp. I39-566]|uniref:DUF6083 domain-containing protein n=1 Tax=Citricoccus sp. I39-566 TaxID=3073268 RepID=UPI00286D1E59|nr:DUF6083 domain-containing protein [Citricoccus sp. I39-566]WMY80064.1 DUF6083 domain-containing protein [Citricoccus sp. I39-566]
MLHPEPAQNVLVDLLLGNTNEHPHHWHKPRRGHCKYCGLQIIWIFTERDRSYPFDLREYDAFGLPPECQWRISTGRPTAIQRPGEKPGSQVLVPHFYVCPQREGSHSTALQRIREANRERAYAESEDAATTV